jgi:hypothetical protein
MAKQAPRDYLYVSTQEVERFTADFAQGGPEAFNHGEGAGVGMRQGVSLAVMGAVAEVESVLRDRHRVRQVADADLEVGDWFESPSLQMAYGVQAARRSVDSDAAVFVGQIDEHLAGAESSLLLSGSAEYLQDKRPTRVEDASGDMSYPSAIFGLLASLSDRKVADRSVGSGVELPADDRRAPTHRQAVPRGEPAREEQWLAVGYPIAQAQSFFGQRGLFPLSFLARAVKVVNFESHGLSGRWIVGTPLWVALQVPE